MNRDLSASLPSVKFLYNLAHSKGNIIRFTTYKSVKGQHILMSN